MKRKLEISDGIDYLKYLTKEKDISDQIINHSRSMITIINRDYIYEKSRIPLNRFHRRAIDKYYPGWDENATVPITARKEDIIIIVVGGTGKHSSYLPAFIPPSVTKEIK